MAAVAAPAVRRPRVPALAAAGVALALVTGAATVVQPKLAVGLVAALVVVVVVAVDARHLPILLASTIFVESVSVGGSLRVGRIGAALALAVVTLYLLARGRSGLRPNALLACVCAFGVWLLASTFWSDYPSATATALAEFGLAVSYMLAFAVLVRSPRQLHQVAITFVVGAVLFGLYGVYQYLTHTGYLGNRADGLQGHPDLYGVYQAIIPPFVLVLAARDRPARWPLYYGSLLVIVLSVAASLTRTAMIVFAVVALAALAVPRRGLFRSRAAKSMYVLALVIAVAAALAVGSATLLARAGSIFHVSPSGDRGAGRTDIWNAAIHAYRDHPWLGIGGGNFAAESLFYLQNTPGVNTAASYVAPDRPAHNAYLEELTELGPVGLALFLAILGLTFRMLFSVVRRARAAGEAVLERFATGVLLALGGFCLAGFFLSSQTLKPFWIFIGLALALDMMTRVSARASRVASPPSRARRARSEAGRGPSRRGPARRAPR